LTNSKEWYRVICKERKMDKKDIVLTDEEIIKINRHANTIGLARARDISVQAQIKLLDVLQKNGVIYFSYLEAERMVSIPFKKWEQIEKLLKSNDCIDCPLKEDK
jgi:hypothetical protein